MKETLKYIKKYPYRTCLEILFVIAWGIFFASIVNL